MSCSLGLDRIEVGLCLVIYIITFQSLSWKGLLSARGHFYDVTQDIPLRQVLRALLTTLRLFENTKFRVLRLDKIMNTSFARDTSPIRQYELLRLFLRNRSSLRPSASFLLIKRASKTFGGLFFGDSPGHDCVTFDKYGTTVCLFLL